MAGEPIEQLIRIIAKAEIDQAVKQAQDDLIGLAKSSGQAFDVAKPRGFTNEVAKFKNQLFSLKPLLGSVGQLFAGFSLASLASSGIQALVQSVKDYFAQTKAAEEASKRLALQLQLLGRSGETPELRKFAADLASVTKLGDASALTLARFAANLGSTADEQQDVISLADSLTRLKFSTEEVTKAVSGFLSARRGAETGRDVLSDVFGFKVDEKNIGRLEELFRLMSSASQIGVGGRPSAFISTEEARTAAGAMSATVRDQERIIELTKELGLVGLDAARIQRERTAELERQAELLERQRREQVQLLRQGIGSVGAQTQQAIADASKLATIYGTVSDVIGTVHQGLMDVTAATVEWALSSERNGQMIRGILARIAGQLAGLLVQYALLSLFGGGGAVSLRGAGGGAGVGGTFGGTAGLIGGGSARGAALGGSSLSAGLRTIGGPGPSDLGGGGEGNLVVADDGRRWFRRMMVEEGGLVLQIVSAGKANDATFKNRLRSRL